MSKLRDFVYAVLAGISISIGGVVYLSLENKMVGALLFSVGLFTVCTFGLNLFTGKVCYLPGKGASYVGWLALVWLGNLVGAELTGLLVRATRIGAALSETAMGLCETKLGDSLPSIFILAIFCNIMIYIGVENYRSNPHEVGKYLGIVFGVIVFILCGFEHCVANMFYFAVANVWSGKTVLYLLVMTLGNTAGGLVFPLCAKIGAKK
mgnify:FL=1